MRNGGNVYFIGGLQLNPGEGDHSLIASIFSRLPEEVECGKNITRFVGYEGHSQASGHLRFFGIEADSTECPSQGLLGWDLSETTWTVFQPLKDRNGIVWKEDIAWFWHNKPASDGGRTTGEFSAYGAAEWWGSVMEARPFRKCLQSP